MAVMGNVSGLFSVQSLRTFGALYPGEMSDLQNISYLAHRGTLTVEDVVACVCTQVDNHLYLMENGLWA